MSERRTAVEQKVTFSWERATRLEAELRHYADVLDERRARPDDESRDRAPRDRR